jgi:hypothetical protein
VKYVKTAERAHALIHRCPHTGRIADVTSDSDAVPPGFYFDFLGKPRAFFFIKIHYGDRCTMRGQPATKGLAQNAERAGDERDLSVNAERIGGQVSCTCEIRA